MHYSLLVIGNNFEEQLAPFDAELAVEEYQEKCFCTETGKNKTPKRPNPDCEECDGAGTFVSTINPDAVYDWYELGGRWKGFFKVKPGKPVTIGELMWKDEEPVPVGRGDHARKGDIDWEGMQSDAAAEAAKFWDKGHKEKALHIYDILPDETREQYINRKTKAHLSTYAILKDGVWYFQDEKSDKQWQKQWKEMVMNLPDSTLLSLVDFHS